MSEHKTNALRLLEAQGIAHEVASLEVGEAHFDAVEVARRLGIDPGSLLKTLVTRAGPDEVFVFCIPGDKDLDLKKAARAAGVRSIDLVPLSDLTPLTGYVRGGCSPVGMKKKFPTWVDQAAEAQARIYVNAGAKGLQVFLAPADLLRAADARYADLV